MSLFKNVVIWSAVLGFSSAQFIKAILKKDFKAFLEYGGMPSGHTSMLTSVLFTMGFREGFSSSIFGLTLVFLVITVSDALRVRRKVGMGHEPMEIIVGGILGAIVGSLTSLLPF